MNNPSYDCEKSLSGGGWHEVQIVRRGKSVTLVVDKIENTADIPGGSGSGFFAVPSAFFSVSNEFMNFFKMRCKWREW